MVKYSILAILCLFLQTPPSHNEGFAVVELFTSEGCSSCPPADDLVATLPKSYPAGVYVLSFHVDYWDRLGWKDAFSRADYTLRQKQYTEALNLKSIYTPQVVVNGKTQMVGSDASRLQETIQDELAHTSNPPLEATAHSADGKTVTVDFTRTDKGRSNLEAALVQLQASTDVKDGENAGKQLHHANIVRDLRSSGKNKGSLTLALPAGLSSGDCKVVIFLQDKNNLHIEGARLLDIH